MKPFFIHRIDATGRETAPLTPPRPDDTTAFLFLTGGEMVVEAAGEPFLCSAGQLLLIPGGIPFTIRHYVGSLGYAGAFSLSFLKDASYPVLRSCRPVHQTFWFEDGVFIGALLARMQTAFGDGDTALLKSGLDLLLGQLKPASGTDTLPDRFLRLVFDRERTLKPISEYARELSVTPNYLNKSVKSQTHRTAMEWVEIARLGHAKQLLKERTLSIEEVASAVGMEDQSYFARFFRKKTGMTPTAFRNNR